MHIATSANIESLTDAEFAAALALFTAEAARRETLAAEGIECDDASCRGAFSHVGLCECRCGGSGHGRAHTAHFPTTAKRTVRNPFAMMAAGRDDDAADAAFGIGPITRSTRAIDPEDMF